jgi:hypothetical protein
MWRRCKDRVAVVTVFEKQLTRAKAGVERSFAIEVMDLEFEGAEEFSATASLSLIPAMLTWWKHHGL